MEFSDSIVGHSADVAVHESQFYRNALNCK